MEIEKKINYILQALFISPVIYIFIGSFTKLNSVSKSILEQEILKDVVNSISIVLPTMILTIVIGVFLAYFESFYEFRFRKFFNYVNVLSFCIPNYILAYIYYDLFSSFLYYHFRVSYDISNIKGAIVLLSLSFYPYVYLFTRSYFKKIPSNIIHSSSLLGKSSLATFIHIVLPLAKPVIIFSSLLVMIETINAYGIFSYFGIQVFSTGLYKLWINTFDIKASFILSSFLIIFIFAIMYLVLKLIGKKSKYQLEFNSNEIERKKLKGFKKFLVLFVFFGIFTTSFVIPLLYLIRFSYYTYYDTNYIDLFKIGKNSVLLTSISSILIVLFNLLIVKTNRLKDKSFVSYSRIFILAYAIPGSIISITLTYIVISIDRTLFSRLILSKSYLVLILAYLFRFSVISYSSISQGINKVGDNYYKASLLLGKSPLKSFLKIDIPLIKNSILSGFLLVFIEIIKELPLTNINGRVETLAIRIAHYSADEAISYIGLPSLILILISFVAMCIKMYIEREKI